MALYAQGGIPESWLVDGETSPLEVYREPWRGGNPRGPGRPRLPLAPA
nr:Uma2 family endonuclease [Thermus neutrinimicus]